MSHSSAVNLSALWCIDFGLRCGFASSPPAAIPACPGQVGHVNEHAVSIFDLIGATSDYGWSCCPLDPLRPAKAGMDAAWPAAATRSSPGGIV